MASSDTLKEYLKKDVQEALGFSVDSPEFDKIMAAFASAIDKYLKTDVKVEIDIEAKGMLDLSAAFPTPPLDPTFQSTYEVETKTTTKGNLV
jgi:hypothetical protein